MAIFSPERIFTALAGMLGMTPLQMQGMVNTFAARFATLETEIDGFKRGSGDMVRHYNARLDAIEGKLDRLLADGATHDSAPINGKRVLTDG